MADKPLTIYSVSDSTGQTAETISRAVIRQFREVQALDFVALPRVTDEAQIPRILNFLLQNQPCVLAYTLSVPALKDQLVAQAEKAQVTTVDLLDPLTQTISSQLGVTPPHNDQGYLRQLDEEYYKRIEAVEFAIKQDDGKDPKGMEKADIILVGVSRTSKTPTCMYLAQNHAVKVANNPLVYNLKPPKELFTHKEKVIGLRVRPEVLHNIRGARLHSLGLSHNSAYANPDQIELELAFADQIMEELGCPVVDVSHRAIEETATEIMFLRYPKSPLKALGG